MSVVDNLLLFRCVQILRRLTQRRRDIGVFCNISGHTLTDTEFFPQFLEFMHHHRDLAGQIVFEFTQDSVKSAKEQEEANLRYLAGMGFQLSMDQVKNLALDFSALRTMGFRYLKVRADTLLSGMQNAHAAVAAEDLKDLLACNNISLIVERIEEADARLEVLWERREREIVAFTSTGRPREFQLRLRIRIRVTDAKGVEWMPPTELLLRREITSSDIEVVSRAQEEELLMREMESEFVNQLLRRLAALKPRD